MKIPSFLLALLLLAASSLVLAVQEVRVEALFNDKALVMIDGQRTLLKAGEPTEDGVELISSDFEEAVIEVGGQRDTYNLSSRVSSKFTAAQGVEVRIARHLNGSYMTSGNINGQRVEMMVDTGATTVAMSETEAKRLGIAYTKGTPAMAQTASGVSRAWAVDLDRVSVGSIELRHVGAMIVQGDSPPMVLLGMSFLGRLDLRNEGNLMILRRR